MKLRDLTLHESAASPPDDVPADFAANARRPPPEAVERLADVLDLAPEDNSRACLSACNQVLWLCPRSRKMQRNVEAWLLAFARDGEVLLLTAPPSDESFRHLEAFPEQFRRLVEQFGIVRSPALGVTGMIAPRALSSARQSLSGSAAGAGVIPFFQHGNGDWDLFIDPAGSVGHYLHERESIEPLAVDLGRWFERRYTEFLC